MKIKVLLNPISGRGRQPQDDISSLRRIFAEHGISPQVILLQQRGQATQLARAAVDENFDMVVAVGGDGTINEIVCGLVNTDVPLGIIPAGSGNGLARTFCIPLDIERACWALLKGRTRQLDVGKLNDRFFLGVAGIGYDALVGKLFEEKWGGRRGLLPYLHTALWGFFRYKVSPIRLRLNGLDMDLLPRLVTIANTRQFGGGAIIAPDAKPDDGLFDICIVHDISFFKALYHWPKLFAGKIDRVPQWEMHRAAAVEIFSQIPVPVHVDGEPIAESTQLKVSLLPGALHVRFPQDPVAKAR
jgi:YegS/Rv2252/BmrU family lipid kinase